jgi:NAD(P)-dependent dehydrogenase (short-subunit alcohol dehydrogenase family)
MMVDLAKTPSFRLDGKRALVTGGGRGIGLAAASALAQAGAHVTLAARTREEIEAAAQAIVARGTRPTRSNSTSPISTPCGARSRRRNPSTCWSTTPAPIARPR